MKLITGFKTVNRIAAEANIEQNVVKENIQNLM